MTRRNHTFQESIPGPKPPPVCATMRHHGSKPLRQAASTLLAAAVLLAPVSWLVSVCHFLHGTQHLTPQRRPISLIPRNFTNILPLVGCGGSILVESHKNGQKNIISFGGVIGGIKRLPPPARPWPPPHPRAAPRLRQRPPRAAPRSSIRHPLALFLCRRSTDRIPSKRTGF
jgi:hypothetical protein